MNDLHVPAIIRFDLDRPALSEVGNGLRERNLDGLDGRTRSGLADLEAHLLVNARHAPCLWSCSVGEKGIAVRDREGRDARPEGWEEMAEAIGWFVEQEAVEDAIDWLAICQDTVRH